MITLRRLNGTEFTLNAELVEQIDRTPDTVITLVTGNNIVVKETVDEVVQKIIEYRKSVAQDRNSHAEHMMTRSR